MHIEPNDISVIYERIVHYSYLPCGVTMHTALLANGTRQRDITLETMRLRQLSRRNMEKKYPNIPCKTSNFKVEL